MIMTQKQEKVIMLDMFEERSKDIATEFDSAISKLKQELQSLENNIEHCDSGQSTIEDRNEIVAINNEIRRLEKERDERINRLSTYQK